MDMINEHRNAEDRLKSVVTRLWILANAFQLSGNPMVEEKLRECVYDIESARHTYDRVFQEQNDLAFERARQASSNILAMALAITATTKEA